MWNMSFSVKTDSNTHTLTVPWNTMDKSLDKFNQIPTKASRVLSIDQDNKFTVVFNKKKKKDPKPRSDVHKSDIKVPDDDGFDINMRQARHEVIRFGISGFESKEREDAKVTMAIKLGAKPPKREYQNYKEFLQDQDKKRKIKAEADSGPLGLLKLRDSLTSSSSSNRHLRTVASRFGGKRKRQDEQNTISAYGKVDITCMRSIKKPARGN